ncbi:MAG: TolC family protein, partial [Planctomycetota bacterium]
MQPQLPLTWSSAHEDDTSDRTDSVDLAEWWLTLNDPTLNELIGLAVAGNQDLQLAHARVREARARRGISAAALWPTVERRATATQTRTSENAFD